MSNANKLGNELVSLCQQGKNVEAIQSLYADNIVSVEAAEGEGFPRRIEGKEAVLGKTKWWLENNEIHSAEVQGPFPHGDDRFAVIFHMDVTSKPTGQRIKMNEIGVYEVADGKVVKEEFYYQMPT